MGFNDLLFITYRIMPFVMVSFLVISSLFSGDLSGFWVLVGLLLSALITIGISKTEFITNSIDSNLLQKCNLITIGSQILSNLPLSTHIFSFVFSYFLYVTKVNELATKNALLLFLLAVILTIDVVFNYYNCAKIYVLIPLIIGAISGTIWAAILGKDNQMIPKMSKNDKCEVNNLKFNCRIKKNGQIIR